MMDEETSKELRYVVDELRMRIEATRRNEGTIGTAFAVEIADRVERVIPITVTEAAHNLLLNLKVDRSESCYRMDLRLKFVDDLREALAREEGEDEE